MFDSLIDYGFQRRFLVIFFAMCLAGLGVWSFTELKVEAYPDISDLQVTVVTLHPGYAAEEVEQQVSVPIERALNSVPNVISRRSRSIFGLSVVDLSFAYGTNQQEARQMVLERLREVELPEGAEPSLAPPTTPAGELYRYRLTGPGMDGLKLRELQDWVVAPRLLQAPGVGDAFPFGGLVKQYQIAVDPMALYGYGLSIQDVAGAVSANNRNAGGSILVSGQQGLVVRGLGLVRSVADIENIVVASRGGVPVFVSQIGRVEVSHAPQAGIFGLNDESGGVEGIVVMRRDENPSEVLKGIRQAVEELNASPLLEGARIEPIYDRTELVASTLRTVSRTLLEALVLVFAVLVFLLGSFRAAVLTAITIPLSLLFAFFCMHLAGVNASLLSLGAIDFGIIVDGTLVMVEYILRRLSRLEDRSGGLETVKRASSEMRRPIFFSMLILISAYLPLFLLERVERRLFMPMAFTIASALLGSLMLSLTLVPVLATYMFPRGVKHWRNPFLHQLTRGYEHLLRALLAHRITTAAATVAIIGIGFWAGGRLGTEFLPQLDEGVIWIRANAPPGISLEASALLASRMRAILRESPQVAFVTSQTGRQESNTEPFGPNRTELLVGLTPYSTWPKGLRKADLVRELSGKLRAGMPGVAFNFTQPIIDMVMENVTGSSADLAVILRGPDLAVLRETAGQVLRLIERVPGATDTSIEQEADQPQVRIQVNRQEAARYGINIADVQQVVEMAIGGRPVSQMFEGDRRFDIAVRYVPEARSTLAGIGGLLIPTADGARIPLSRVAETRIADGASLISRRENQRIVCVRTNIRGRDQGSFVAEAQRRFREEIRLEPGYSVEWGGQFENLHRAQRRLAWILPITVALIFTILYWAFDSVLKAALVLLTVPLSMVGGIAALLLRGIPFSVSAAVGFVSLFGVAVMSGVLFVAEVQRQRNVHDRPLKETVLVGACVQFRPMLTVILLAMLGMVPAALAQGIGSDVQRPLATVVLGGLVSTLFLTLPTLPCLYYLAADRGRRRE
ncbi:MAG: efflux RND transporter permease subunit [Bryobacteraceae bacterium]